MSAFLTQFKITISFLVKSGTPFNNFINAFNTFLNNQFNNIFIA